MAIGTAIVAEIVARKAPTADPTTPRQRQHPSRAASRPLKIAAPRLVSRAQALQPLPTARPKPSRTAKTVIPAVAVATAVDEAVTAAKKPRPITSSWIATYCRWQQPKPRTDEHTSELKSLMRTQY